MSEFKDNFGGLGMNLEQSLAQLKKGKLTYALNASIEGADGQYVNYQNILGNESCVVFPDGYTVIGVHTLYETNLIIYWLTNPTTGDSEIGSSGLEDCTYSTIINAKCLNLSIEHPILSSTHRISNCSTQIFWVDGYNRDRFIDLNKLPYEEIIGVTDCQSTYSGNIDCNKLSLNPLYSIPLIDVKEIDGDGTLISGTYQFAIQYANANGEGYTSYHSLTNPIPIFDVNNVSLDFNLPVNKSIVLTISDIDITGFYDYYNIAVIKTVNNISTAELVGTFAIRKAAEDRIYTGQITTQLSIEDITQKYPIYETSQDLTTTNDILIRDQLTSAERLSYQEIANKISIDWQTYKLTKEFTYKNPKIATQLRGYMRDEVYAFEVVFLLKDGIETDRFHIPGREATPDDLEPILNDDTVDGDLTDCDTQGPLPKWKVYNTGSLYGYTKEYLSSTGNQYSTFSHLGTPVQNNSSQSSSKDTCYVGSYQRGQMAYWESEETYPCDSEVWGTLKGKKIRHHKFPDSLSTHIHDDKGNIYPIGITISLDEIRQLIANSSLTSEQKAKIVGFKILRGNRANNKSIVAKGLINNIGKYKTNENTFFYPNYPYNDRGPDPFISTASNALNPTNFNDSTGFGQPYNWEIFSCCDDATYDYTDAAGNSVSVLVKKNTTVTVCSASKPITQTSSGTKSTVTPKKKCGDPPPTIPQVNLSGEFEGFSTDDSKFRYVFHSPDTHFYQPFLGNILKLETAEVGYSKGHFVQVKEHAKYKLYTAGLYGTSLGVAIIVAVVSRVVGLVDTIIDGTAIFTTYKAMVDILEKTVPRINYAYQYNSNGNYDGKAMPIPNDGNKQRLLNISLYMNPGMASVGDTHIVNNFQRESSVYLKTNKTLPYTDERGVDKDISRWKPFCDNPYQIKQTPISSYYASIKKNNVNQYGQIFSYNGIDTGYQFKISDSRDIVTVFGGDIFINKFAYKTKFPYFIDNAVKAPDGSDIFYNELSNVGIPNYWFSLDSTKGHGLAGFLDSMFGIPVTHLDCETSQYTYKRGRMYLFSYGIPNFYCESEVNVDNRQAFNNKEGDFFPHVSTDIPDDWLQEVNVSINYDNTYYYNKTYSKQNNDMFYSSLPIDFTVERCKTIFPYRAVFSEPRTNDAQSTQRNNWLIYKPISYYDFPQNFGKLTSLDGMEYRQVLARFENRSQIYNALLTAPTSQANVYLGQTLFSSQTPPIDLSNTDQGYMGSRHKFLLKTEFGMLTTDDKRGQIFLVNGQQTKNLTSSESGVEQFFNKNLEVTLPKLIKGVPIDNSFNGVGIHGVYDAKYNQAIITKLDYQPIVTGITYDKGFFYYKGKQVQLTDTTYFCNKSFTITYDFDEQSWVSFMSILPSYYIGSSNFYLSGYNNKSWRHYTTDKYCYFYDEQHPYIIEYPFSFQIQDEILQSVVDYSKVFQYIDGDPVEINDVWYNKVILYNNQQCSGILNVVQKPKNNLAEYMKYPLYSNDSKTILYTKSDNLYKINQFWSLVKDNKQPIFRKTCQALSFDKEINQDNMDYNKRSFKKAPLRAKDLKCRFILDNRYDTRIVSQITLVETQKSFK